MSCLSKSFSVLKASHSPPLNLFSSLFVAAPAEGLRFEEETLGDDLLGVNGALLGVNGALLLGAVGRNGRRGLDLALSSKLCLPGLWVGFTFVAGALLSEEEEEASWLTSEPC